MFNYFPTYSKKIKITIETYRLHGDSEPGARGCDHISEPSCAAESSISVEEVHAFWPSLGRALEAVAMASSCASEFETIVMSVRLGSLGDAPDFGEGPPEAASTAISEPSCASESLILRRSLHLSPVHQHTNTRSLVFHLPTTKSDGDQWGAS